MNARVIAGNLFAVVSYGIFVGTLFITIGLVASLEGWNESAQIFWYICPYNMSFGTGILIMIFMGLLGVVIVANIIMLISINFRNSKVSTIISIGVIIIFLRLTQTENQLQLQLNPIFFGTHFTTTNLTEFEIFHFIGELMIPYSLLSLILFGIYMTIIRLLTLRSYKKYRLN